MSRKKNLTGKVKITLKIFFYFGKFSYIYDMETNDDFKGLEDAFNEMKNSSFNKLFMPPKEVEFTSPKLDFTLDPDHFVRWLCEEHGSDPHSDFDYVEGDYRHNVGNECEFSCLYIAMLLHGKELDSEPVIYCGNFGFWEHYWIGYTYKGIEYFIDLTLMQFLENAPKLAISFPVNADDGYNWLKDIEPQPISEYLEEKRAFQFYKNPKEVK